MGAGANQPPQYCLELGNGGNGGDRGGLLRRDVALDRGGTVHAAAAACVSLVRIGGFAKDYGATQVFAGVELDVAEGEIRILLGPSGCGRTTLLRAVAGLVQPDAGTLVIAG